MLILRKRKSKVPKKAMLSTTQRTTTIAAEPLGPDPGKSWIEILAEAKELYGVRGIDGVLRLYVMACSQGYKGSLRDWIKDATGKAPKAPHKAR